MYKVKKILIFYKGFFIRSYKDLKYEEYKCKLNECVSKIKSCRYCRFQKCKSLGMSLDGI
jgi:hypothetical protein